MVARIVCIAVCLLFYVVPEASAFAEPGLLTRPIKATVIKGASIDEALDLLADDYGIPVGIELGDAKLKRQEIDLTLPKTNLKEFLDALIAKDPRYTWKLEGAVIHVWPVKERDAFITTLLDTKIAYFTFAGNKTRYAIFNDIMEVPEIQTQLIVANVAPLIFLHFGSMQRVGTETSFYESNLTLRDLLDRIVLQTDIKQWVITRWGDKSEYITLRS